MNESFAKQYAEASAYISEGAENTDLHTELVGYVLRARRGWVLNPLVFNMALLSLREEEYRKTISGSEIGRAVDPLTARKICADLHIRLCNGMDEIRKYIWPHSAKAREDLAWESHALFICANTFRDGNGRTGRLLFLNLMITCGAEAEEALWHIQDALRYKKRFDAYREEQFLPTYVDAIASAA